MLAGTTALAHQIDEVTNEGFSLIRAEPGWNGFNTVHIAPEGFNSKSLRVQVDEFSFEHFSGKRLKFKRLWNQQPLTRRLLLLKTWNLRIAEWEKEVD